MLSGLVVVLTSLFGGVLYIAAPPPPFHSAYITFKCEQIPSKQILVWTEMEYDYIDGIRILKHRMRECANETFNLKIKIAYRNFTSETDWITYYQPTGNITATTTTTTNMNVAMSVIQQICYVLILILLLCWLVLLMWYSIRKMKEIN